MKVENKVMVVTGAGSGIGRELVLLLLSKGARVAGVDLNPKSLDETADLASAYTADLPGSLSMSLKGRPSRRCPNKCWHVSGRWMASSTMPASFNRFRD